MIMLCYHSIILSQTNIIIDKITVYGNNITKETVILRELLFKKNSQLSYNDLKNKILESEKNLLNLSLFNFVDIQHTVKENIVEININLIERWYIWPYPILEISDRNFNTWWKEFKSNDYYDFSRLNYGLFLNWENFRGKNDVLKLKLRKGFKEHYLISYMMPYFNKKKTIGINTYAQLFRRKKSFYNTINDTLIYYTDPNNYTTKEYELSSQILFRKSIYNKHLIKFTYNIAIVDQEIVKNNPFYLHNDKNSGSYTKLSYQFISDHRDFIQYPLNGYYVDFESSKYFNGTSPVNHFEIIGRIEKHIELEKNIFLGSSFKFKITSDEYQPYFMQKGFGFEDYVRGYEYYVVDGQEFWLSKTILKYALFKNKKFDIPYIKMEQFRKSHFSLYIGMFSDMGYIIDNQNNKRNQLPNSLLWGKGIHLDYVTYYDKLLRIEFAFNHLGEKGIFLHFSNPFGDKRNKL